MCPVWLLVLLVVIGGCGFILVKVLCVCCCLPGRDGEDSLCLRFVHRNSSNRPPLAERTALLEEDPPARSDYKSQAMHIECTADSSPIFSMEIEVPAAPNNSIAYTSSSSFKSYLSAKTSSPSSSLPGKPVATVRHRNPSPELPFGNEDPSTRDGASTVSELRQAARLPKPRTLFGSFDRERTSPPVSNIPFSGWPEKPTSPRVAGDGTLTRTGFQNVASHDNSLARGSHAYDAGVAGGGDSVPSAFSPGNRGFGGCDVNGEGEGEDGDVTAVLTECSEVDPGRAAETGRTLSVISTSPSPPSPGSVEVAGVSVGSGFQTPPLSSPSSNGSFHSAVVILSLPGTGERDDCTEGFL